MKWNVLPVILLLSLICSPVSADEPTPQFVKSGDPVPWDAQCMTLRRAANLAAECSLCTKRTEAEVKLATDLSDIALALSRQQHAIDNEKHSDQMEIMDKRIERALVWYRSPLFVGSVTVVLTVAGLLTARHLIVELSP